MKIKKYQAPSMPEAMKKVRSELGPQAVILQSKTVYTGGLFGLFKKKNIEVVAAVDPAATIPLKQSETKTAPVFPIQPVPQAVTIPDDFKREMAEMKNMIKKLKNPASQEFFYPDAIKPIIEKLEQQGVSSELQQITAKHLLEKWSIEKVEKVEEKTVKSWAVEFLANYLPQAPSIEKAVRNVYLLGPTGVGKTTTLAKLASKKVLEEEKNIAFLTADTYRIAAIEQLKTYAGLLQAPLKAAYSQQDFKDALLEFSQADIVFVDTAGRNYREKKFVEDLQQLMASRPKQSVYFLVLSVAAKEEDLQEIINNFASLQIDGFIFTKLDETRTKGTIVNLMHTNQIGTAFVTNGQNVPDDIIKTTNNMIVQSLFED